MGKIITTVLIQNETQDENSVHTEGDFYIVNDGNIVKIVPASNAVYATGTQLLISLSETKGTTFWSDFEGAHLIDSTSCPSNSLLAAIRHFINNINNIPGWSATIIA